MLASFRLYFYSWIQLLYVISGVLMERSKTYTVLLHLSELSTFIFAVHSYIGALPSQVKSESGYMLYYATILAKYTTYVNDITELVIS